MIDPLIIPNKINKIVKLKDMQNIENIVNEINFFFSILCHPNPDGIFISGTF